MQLKKKHLSKTCNKEKKTKYILYTCINDIINKKYFWIVTNLMYSSCTLFSPELF